MGWDRYRIRIDGLGAAITPESPSVQFEDTFQALGLFQFYLLEPQSALFPYYLPAPHAHLYRY
jgi:hypothetical protein